MIYGEIPLTVLALEFFLGDSAVELMAFIAFAIVHSVALCHFSSFWGNCLRTA
jgi:hypothetical protein